jgi:hypothetical protein
MVLLIGFTMGMGQKTADASQNPEDRSLDPALRLSGLVGYLRVKQG